MGKTAAPEKGEETRVEESKFGKPSPFYPSPAGKIRLTKVLIPMFDANHSTYTEAFMGGAACFFMKPKVKTEALSDLNPDVPECYITVRDMTDADLEKFMAFDWRARRSTFLKLKGSDPKDKLQRLYKELYLRRLSIARGKGTYLEGEDNEAVGIGQHVARARPRLKGVNIYHQDYAKTLQKYDGSHAFHYLDPPYDNYNHRVGESDFDVARFRKVLQGLKGHWLVTYGAKGALDTSGTHKMIIRPRRHPAARVGGSKALTTLILTNYKLSRKSAEAIEDSDWEIIEMDDAPTLVTFSGGAIQRVKSIEPAGDVFDEHYFEGREEADVDYAALFTEVAKHLEGQEILEVGCGPGRGLGLLTASGAKVQGVDLSSYAVEKAVAKGLQVVREDATDLSFADGAFDTAFSIDLLGHVPRAEKAIAESLRVAKQRAVHLVHLSNGSAPGRDTTQVKAWSSMEEFVDWLGKAGVDGCFTKRFHLTTSPGGRGEDVLVAVFDKQDEALEAAAAKRLGGFDFQEGEHGYGILQTHERGLVEDQAKEANALGWEPVQKAEDGGGLDALDIHTDLRLVRKGDDHWQGGEVLTPGDQYQENAFSGPMTDPVPMNLQPPAVITKRALPIHHTATSDKPWDGPGAKARLKNDGTADYYRGAFAWVDPDGDPEKKAAYKFIHHEVGPDGKVGAANLKACSSSIAILNGGRGGTTIPAAERQGVWSHVAAHLKDADQEPAELSKSADVTRGHLAWLDVGKRTAQAFPPGRPGSTEDSWSRFRVRKSFKWWAGVQTEDEREFWFEGDGIRGRYLVKRAADGWTIERPEDQELASKALAEVAETVEVIKTFYCPIVKAEVRSPGNGKPPERVVTGVVLQPETVDAQGDIYSAEVVKEAAYRYLADYNHRTRTGYMHKEFGRDLDLVESWVTREEAKFGSQQVKKGSWMMSQRVNDDAAWEKVKAGEINGFSIGGVARAQRLRD